MKNKSRTSLVFFSCSRFLADNVSKLRSRNNKLVTFATDGTPLKYFVIKFFNLVRLFCNSKKVLRASTVNGEDFYFATVWLQFLSQKVIS